MDVFHEFGIATFTHEPMRGTPPARQIAMSAETFINIDPSVRPVEGFTLDTYAPAGRGLLVRSTGCRLELSQMPADSTTTDHRTVFFVDFGVDAGSVSIDYAGRYNGHTAEVRWERVGGHFELTDFEGNKIGFTRDRVWEIISDLDRAKAQVREELTKKAFGFLEIGDNEAYYMVASLRDDEAYVEQEAHALLRRGG
jgi:hypothetical protein